MGTQVIILSGISGSGKSTYARRNYPGAVVCSADKFPGLYVDGELQFAKLSDAHNACLREFTVALLEGAPVIVVDNTNTTATEIAPYAAMALAFGAKLQILTIECDVEIAHGRNLHNVPRGGVEAQAARLESRDLPPWWPVRSVAAAKKAA
jgi:predicted kinase